MSWIVEVQNTLVTQSPALYPLLGLIYSVLSSFHCTVMCTPFVPKKKNDYYHFGRILSYTLIGSIMGGFGLIIKKSLEYELIAVFSFILFAVFTLSLVFSDTLAKKIHFPKSILGIKNSFLRGILSGFLPCHLLFFFYSLAGLSATFWGGALILFTHSIATIPALSLGQNLLGYIAQNIYFGRKLVKILILLICVINLFFFGAQLFSPVENVKSKVLFCL